MNVRPNVREYKVKGYRVVVFRNGCLEPVGRTFLSEQMALAEAERFREWFPGTPYGVRETVIFLN